ncbi:MAG: tripartite tricarboxylate transporter TctB family protein [Alphaproteobacteria bacterium]
MERGRGEASVAVAVLALAALIIWQAGTIPTPLYAQLGPRVAPYIVGAGLAVLGAALLAAALSRRWQAEPEEEGAPDLPALAWLAGGLVLNVLLIQPLGFIVASTALFAFVARGFGSTRWLRNAAIGLAIALLAYLGFEKVLGIHVGAGILEGVL